MYQTFFIITFKSICEAIEIYSDHGDGWFDRNLTTFHLCWTKVFATHLYPHKIFAVPIASFLRSVSTPWCVCS